MISGMVLPIARDGTRHAAARPEGSRCPRGGTIFALPAPWL